MKLVLVIISFFSFSEVYSQIFGKSDLCLQQGVMNYSWSGLNNRSNSNTKPGFVTELDRNLMITPVFSFNYGIGAGGLGNPDTLFKLGDHSDFFRIKFGFNFHLPQKYKQDNWSPSLFNPYIRIAYNTDFMDARFREISGNALSSSLKLGLGAVVRVKHEVGILLELSHNQKVNYDYRSYIQFNIGLMINMDQKYLPY